MAPSDTAEVSAMAIARVQSCVYSPRSDTLPRGRTTELWYQVTMESPNRTLFLIAGFDTRDFRGSVGFSAHPRGIWGSSMHVEPIEESADNVAAGPPCGE